MRGVRARHRYPSDILGNVRPRTMPAGRGIFVSRRRGNLLVQTGLMGGQDQR